MKQTLYILSIVLVVLGCKNNTSKNTNTVVTTTTMITDLVTQIGGDVITVQGLMGSGVDPHLYKASEGDVTKLTTADIIFYNGLHLEGKLTEVFEKMQHQNIKTVAITDCLDPHTLIGSDYFKSNYDPHIWFDIDYWKQVTLFVVAKLSETYPEHTHTFKTNGNAYLNQLLHLKQTIKTAINILPKDQRVLVTAHDAFSYFGRAFDFKVVGLQGLSTVTEAGVQDVQKLATFIIDKQIKAIFVESSVPKRTIEALQAAVKSKGHNVYIGGTLYSDALGDVGTVEGTYLGMFKYNVNTIVNALK